MEKGIEVGRKGGLGEGGGRRELVHPALYGNDSSSLL